jgi:hypothetical protein
MINQSRLMNWIGVEIFIKNLWILKISNFIEYAEVINYIYFYKQHL